MAHFQFKIKLRGVSKPPVWRKVDVPSNTPFDIFSQIIQDVFGWYGHHMWHFTPKQRQHLCFFYFSPLAPATKITIGQMSEAHVKSSEELHDDLMRNGTYTPRKRRF